MEREISPISFDESDGGSDSNNEQVQRQQQHQQQRASKNRKRVNQDRDENDSHDDHDDINASTISDALCRKKRKRARTQPRDNIYSDVDNINDGDVLSMHAAENEQASEEVMDAWDVTMLPVIGVGVTITDAVDEARSISQEYRTIQQQRASVMNTLISPPTSSAQQHENAMAGMEEVERRYEQDMSRVRRRAKHLLYRLNRGYCMDSSNVSAEFIGMYISKVLDMHTIPIGGKSAIEVQKKTIYSAMSVISDAMKDVLKTIEEQQCYRRFTLVVDSMLGVITYMHKTATMGDPTVADIGDNNNDLAAINPGQEDHEKIMQFTLRTMKENNLYVDGDGYIVTSEKFYTCKGQGRMNVMYDTLMYTRLKQNDQKPLDVRDFIWCILSDKTLTYNKCIVDPRYFSSDEDIRIILNIDKTEVPALCQLVSREQRVSANVSPDNKAHARGTAVMDAAVTRLNKQSTLPLVPERETGTVAFACANGIFLAHASERFADLYCDGVVSPRLWAYDDPSLPRHDLVCFNFLKTQEEQIPIYIPYYEYLLHVEEQRVKYGKSESEWFDFMNFVSLGISGHEARRRCRAKNLKFPFERRSNDVPSQARRFWQGFNWNRGSARQRQRSANTVNHSNQLHQVSTSDRGRILRDDDINDDNMNGQVDEDDEERLPLQIAPAGTNLLRDWTSFWKGQDWDDKMVRWHIAWMIGHIILSPITKARGMTFMFGASNAGKTTYLETLLLLCQDDRVKEICVPMDPNWPASELCKSSEYDVIYTSDIATNKPSRLPQNTFYNVVDGRASIPVRGVGTVSTRISASWIGACNKPGADFIAGNDMGAGYRRTMFFNTPNALSAANSTYIEHGMQSSLGLVLLFGLHEYYRRYKEMRTKKLMDKGFEPDFSISTRNDCIRVYDIGARVLCGPNFVINLKDPDCAILMNDLMSRISIVLHAQGTSLDRANISEVGIINTLKKVLGVQVRTTTRPYKDNPHVHGTFAIGIREAGENEEVSEVDALQFICTVPFKVHPANILRYVPRHITTLTELDTAFATWANYNGQATRSLALAPKHVFEAVINDANKALGERIGRLQEKQAIEESTNVMLEDDDEDRVEEARTINRALERSKRLTQRSMPQKDAYARHASKERSGRSDVRQQHTLAGAGAAEHQNDSTCITDDDIVALKLHTTYTPTTRIFSIRERDALNNRGRFLQNVRYMGTCGSYFYYFLHSCLVQVRPSQYCGNVVQLGEPSVPTQGYSNVEQRIRSADPTLPEIVSSRAMHLGVFVNAMNRYVRAFHPRMPILRIEHEPDAYKELDTVLRDINEELNLSKSPKRLALLHGHQVTAKEEYYISGLRLVSV